MVPQRFPESVSVEEDNQRILDACKYVIVSVLPKQGGTSINDYDWLHLRHVHNF